MNRFQTQWQGILQKTKYLLEHSNWFWCWMWKSYLNPCKNKCGKWWCKLHNMAQWKSIKVQNDASAANLCGWFQHWRSDSHLNSTEHIVQRAFRWFPFFYWPEQRHKHIKLIVLAPKQLTVLIKPHDFYLLPHWMTKIRDPFRSRVGTKRTSSCSYTWITLFGYRSS